MNEVSEEIKGIISKSIESLDLPNKAISLEHPTELSHGDYSANIALALSKEVGENPRALAEKIVSEISKNLTPNISKVEVAGPGFINFYLSEEFFNNSLLEIKKLGDKFGSNKNLTRKKVMVEYTQPNPFKEFHIGHLMSNAIGESVSRVVEFEDADIIRANYQGDVGLHVAKAMWAILRKKEQIPAESQPLLSRIQFISACYVEGSKAYEEDENSKKEIDEINKKIYLKSDDEINRIYSLGREWTLAHFEEIYKILGTKFDHYFFESECAKIGSELVLEFKEKGVFEDSNGATVFHGEKFGLHTRVFITSNELPTYEAKELGLTKKKFDLYNPDISIVDTAVEQKEYMKVVMASIGEMFPDIRNRMKHITHGMMRFSSGKMSSRKGNIITGESLLTDATEIIHEKMKEREMSESERKEISEMVAVSAIKFSILRQAVGTDIIYDEEKSISYDGDSGPYIQYTAVRAKSVLQKAYGLGIKGDIVSGAPVYPIEKILYRFPEIVSRSGEDLTPHHIATYLLDLSSAFNSFYGGNPIADLADSNSPKKVLITENVLQTIKNGLWLLGIKTPEKM